MDETPEEAPQVPPRLVEEQIVPFVEDPEVTKELRVRPSQWDTLSIMLLRGAHPEKIAENLGVSQRSVSYYANGNSEGFNQVKAAYRDRFVRTETHHHERLNSMAELAYKALEDSLLDKEGTVAERKLRLDAAEKVINRLFPEANKASVSVELTQNNLTVQTEVREKISEIAGRFPELLEIALRQDPAKHLRGLEEPKEAPAPIDVEFTDDPDGQ